MAHRERILSSHVVGRLPGHKVRDQVLGPVPISSFPESPKAESESSKAFNCLPRLQRGYCCLQKIAIPKASAVSGSWF